MDPNPKPKPPHANCAGLAEMSSDARLQSNMLQQLPQTSAQPAPAAARSRSTFSQSSRGRWPDNVRVSSHHSPLPPLNPSPGTLNPNRARRCEFCNLKPKLIAGIPPTRGGFLDQSACLTQACPLAFEMRAHAARHLESMCAHG